MKYIIVLYMVLNIVSIPVQAQADKDVIKGAAATASEGVGGSNTKKLPSDSLKWKKGGDISLNLSQMQLSNWAAGGENSLSFTSSSNLFANYKKNKMIWENYAFMAYGILKAGDRKAIKNSDQLNIGSRVGYKMAKNWYYTAALLGKTQFASGYKYDNGDTTRISDFLAPAYMFLSLGLDYKPSSKFSVSLSPAMGKATFVRSDDPVVLVSSGIPQEGLSDDGKTIIGAPKKTRYEFGGGIVVNLNGSYFSKRFTYTSQLELFSNYFDNPQNIDVVWDLQLRVVLTKYISSGVRINMMFYDNQKTFEKDPYTDKMVQHGAKLQSKEYFEIGLFYAF
jgi:hypothetical protein